MSIPSLLKKLRDSREQKLKVFATSIIKKKYIVSPLPSHKSKEILKTGISGFDCVTLVEHYLASINSTNLSEYKNNLKKIRYSNSVISWKTRKHYLSTWLKDNQKNKFLKIKPIKNPKIKKALLNIIPGISEIKCKFKYDTEINLSNGDIIAFVSSKDNLDYFHVGIILNAKKKTILHASKSNGSVMEESLNKFLKRTSCIGFTVHSV